MAVPFVNKPLADWQNVTPAYTPLSQVAYAPQAYIPGTPAPQMPNPTGIRGGNNIQQINKRAKFPGVIQVLNFSRSMTKF